VYHVRQRLRRQTDKITVTIGVHGVITAKVARERATEIIGLLFVRKSEQKTAESVFPSENGGRAADPRMRVEEIVKKSGITFTPPDLRRTFATVAESLDLSWNTVKSLLNHKMEDYVTAGYVVSDAERMRIRGHTIAVPVD
jgi:integrase